MRKSRSFAPISESRCHPGRSFASPVIQSSSLTRCRRVTWRFPQAAQSSQANPCCFSNLTPGEPDRLGRKSRLGTTRTADAARAWAYRRTLCLPRHILGGLVIWEIGVFIRHCEGDLYMKFCANCGKSLALESKFCADCGAGLGITAIPLAEMRSQLPLSETFSVKWGKPIAVTAILMAVWVLVFLICKLDFDPGEGLLSPGTVSLSVGTACWTVLDNRQLRREGCQGRSLLGIVSIFCLIVLFPLGLCWYLSVRGQDIRRTRLRSSTTSSDIRTHLAPSPSPVQAGQLSSHLNKAIMNIVISLFVAYVAYGGMQGWDHARRDLGLSSGAISK
jgi:hypothetical protein